MSFYNVTQALICLSLVLCEYMDVGFLMLDDLHKKSKCIQSIGLARNVAGLFWASFSSIIDNDWRSPWDMERGWRSFVIQLLIRVIFTKLSKEGCKEGSKTTLNPFEMYIITNDWSSSNRNNIISMNTFLIAHLMWTEEQKTRMMKENGESKEQCRNNITP